MPFPVANDLLPTPVASYDRPHGESTTRKVTFSNGQNPITGGFGCDPPPKAIVRSLGTPDRRQAEILSLPLIAAHKAALLAARPQLVLRPYTLPPGREYATENGERVVATEHDLIYFDTDGKLLRTEPNSPSQKSSSTGQPGPSSHLVRRSPTNMGRSSTLPSWNAPKRR